VKLVKAILILSIGIAGCQSPGSNQAEQTALLETQAAIAIQSFVSTFAAQTETARAISTQTHTPIPETATITPTASDTATPSETPNLSQTQTAQALAILITPRGNGHYLVGVDIAPGVWRSENGYSGCYWSVTTKTGSIINNDFGDSGGTVYISPTAYEVEFSDCGIFTYLGAP